MTCKRCGGFGFVDGVTCANCCEHRRVRGRLCCRCGLLVVKPTGRYKYVPGQGTIFHRDEPGARQEMATTTPKPRLVTRVVPRELTELDLAKKGSELATLGDSRHKLLDEVDEAKAVAKAECKTLEGKIEGITKAERELRVVIKNKLEHVSRKVHERLVPTRGPAQGMRELEFSDPKTGKALLKRKARHDEVQALLDFEEQGQAREKGKAKVDGKAKAATASPKDTPPEPNATDKNPDQELVRTRKNKKTDG